MSFQSGPLGSQSRLRSRIALSGANRPSFSSQVFRVTHITDKSVEMCTTRGAQLALTLGAKSYCPRTGRRSLGLPPIL